MLHVCAPRLRVRSPHDDDSEHARTGRVGHEGHTEPPGVPRMRTAPLTAQARQDALDAMRGSAERGNELDILVIGGGVTGAGVALEAATRGLSVGIVEAQDWASGTSSRSSQAGPRRPALPADARLPPRPRGPHRARPADQPARTAPGQARGFLYPLEHRVWERAYVGAGVALYDTLATASGSRRALPFHRHLSRKGMLRQFPDLRHDAAVGARSTGTPPSTTPGWS